MFDKKINILVTGAKGQLGSYLVDYFRKKSFLKKSNIDKVFGIDVEDLDIRDSSAVADFFNKSVVNPLVDIDYVIHCAAATDTAAIEKDPEKYYAVNCLGPKNIATSCAYNGIKMVFISTDYVLSEHSELLDGRLVEFPVNQYGLQKLIAEQFVKEAYRGKEKDLMVLRSSWMYGNSDRSFVEKLLKNVFTSYAKKCASGYVDAKPNVSVKVVDDAWGRPTSTWFIADTIDSLVLGSFCGTTDLQYSCKQISRYDWAKMIWREFIDVARKECNDEDMVLVNDMSNSVSIDPAKSSDFGPGMHHPGKVNDYGIDSTSLYENDMWKYMNRNVMKYISMAKQAVAAAREDVSCKEA